MPDPTPPQTVGPFFAIGLPWDDGPEVVARGFVSDEGTADVLAEGARVVATTIEEASIEERGDPGLMKERIRVELRRFLTKRTGRRPMVLPVVMEV